MNATNMILLRRKNLLIVEPKNADYEQPKNEQLLVVTMMKNVQYLGFTFSKELFASLSHLTREEIKVFYSDLIPALKESVGADVEYTPMYPNFPTQVAEMDGIELFINAIVHYWSFGTLMPEYEKDERLPLIDVNKMAVLSTGTNADLMGIFKNLVSSKTSLSVQDKKDVTTIIKNCEDYADYLPDEIPLKEIAALIGKLIIEEAPIKSVKAISKYFRTATDVLRLVTALSDGDISLARKTKYRNLKRCERRMILDLLANCGDITEDLFRYQNKWIRVAEILHPFEYGYPRYKEVNRAFNALRNNKKPLMFCGKVQSAILRKDMESAADLLKFRPGEFARQLDKMLRDSHDPEYILECFKSVAVDISAPVLLQVRQHFIGRMAETTDPIRVFFQKGSLAKAIFIKNELPAIDKTICRNVAMACRNALIEQYSSKESLGKVYVDEDFKNYLVPFSGRSASSTSKNIVRGSRLHIKPDATAIRAFIWWTNTNKESGEDDGRVDIDLSAAIYDSDWKFIEHVSYTHLRSSNVRMYHSGDITNGGGVDGKGVSEFIDVDIDNAASHGRYIVFQIYNYTLQKYADLDNCRFGWMEREEVDSGEIFEPATVRMIMDVNAECTASIPVIFDCFERKFIWCDMSLSMECCLRGGNNFESNFSDVTAICYAMTHLNKPNIYDLAMFNAMARGNMVTDRNEADLIFSNDTTTPFEIITEIDEKTGEEKRVVKDKADVPIVTSFDIDYFIGKLL